jgi:Flp pilus assembly protein CpaB
VALAHTTWLPRTLAPPRRLPGRAILGLALALAAVAMVYTVSRSTQPRTVDVLRATHDVPVGAVLRAGDVAAVSEALPDDVAQTLAPASERESFVGHRVGQPLNAGELVSRRQMKAPGRQIGAGQRVYTIPVSPEAAAGGQAVDAGDEVEVVVTINKGLPDQARTQVVLPRATVYQVGRQDASYTPLGGTDQSVGDTKLTSLTLLLASDVDYQAVARARWIGDLDVAVLGTGEAN